MSYAYQAYDRAGRAVSGTLDAHSPDAARAQLKAKGLFVVELGSGRPAAARGTPATHRARGGNNSLATTASVARQLSVLLSTGTPVADALGAAIRQARDEKVKQTLRAVRSAVEEGVGLADALRRQGGLFDPVMCSLVAAGEASGRLDVMLARVASIARQQLTVSKAVTGALVYPAVLLSISLIVTVVMLVLVVPRFAGMFQAMQAPLPATTEVLLTLSAAVRGYWWAGGPALLLAAGGAYFWSRTGRGRVAFDGLLLALPGIGSMVRSLASARIARLLGVLLDARVPLLESLELVEASTASAAYRSLIASARDTIVDGGTLAETFAASTLVTPSVAEAIRNGEVSARLGEVMHNVATHLDEDNAAAVKGLTTLIEPAIVLIMGVLVGGIAISMFMPLFDLTAMAGKGG